jgi:hypothetical protein
MLKTIAAFVVAGTFVSVDAFTAAPCLAVRTGVPARASVLADHKLSLRRFLLFCYALSRSDAEESVLFFSTPTATRTKATQTNGYAWLGESVQTDSAVWPGIFSIFHLSDLSTEFLSGCMCTGAPFRSFPPRWQRSRRWSSKTAVPLPPCILSALP